MELRTLATNEVIQVHQADLLKAYLVNQDEKYMVGITTRFLGECLLYNPHSKKCPSFTDKNECVSVCDVFNNLFNLFQKQYRRYQDVVDSLFIEEQLRETLKELENE